MKSWIKIACITAFVSQIAACSSTNQTINDSRPAQTVQKRIQQHAEGQGIFDIPETYKNK
ncbi:thermonuclease [Bacillus wiedmannii]|nr:MULTISPECIES: thermonuclease [Bacillus]AZJ23969.1 thermonuclease [Bacillus wiedmannii bv. thuringiensis]MCU5500752.1 thermonuclease [Bacillus wiedmannii]MED2885637.1 thermonuclease [Bacillus wiedmannii]PEC59106.1 thermonuclease [Bacillus wiedmannii]PEI33163.1 thermonuclease [Bacillus wiedmannii]